MGSQILTTYAEGALGIQVFKAFMASNNVYSQGKSVKLELSVDFACTLARSEPHIGTRE